MTAPKAPKEDRGQPADRLVPPLDALVEKISAQEPPEDVVRRSIQRARQAGPTPGNRLSQRPYRRHTRALALATAAGLACVSLAWWFTGNDGEQVEIVGRPSPVEIEPSDPTPPDVPVVEEKPAAPSPTFWAYHRAALRSPEDLHALLDEHARQYAFRGPASTGLGYSMKLSEETL